MIVHTIVKFMPKPIAHRRAGVSKKFKGVIGSEAHKRFILRRALEKLNFEEYECVKYKGNYCWINLIMDEKHFTHVEWNALSPLCIEIVDKEGTYYYVNPGQLRKVKN